MQWYYWFLIYIVASNLLLTGAILVFEDDRTECGKLIPGSLVGGFLVVPVLLATLPFLALKKILEKK